MCAGAHSARRRDVHATPRIRDRVPTTARRVSSSQATSLVFFSIGPITCGSAYRVGSRVNHSGACVYLSAQEFNASRIGRSSLPASVSEYSTFGGTTG